MTVPRKRATPSVRCHTRYDGNDNLLTRITPKNETISFAYNAVNQLLSKTLPGSQVTSCLRGLSSHPAWTARALLCTVPPSLMGYGLFVQHDVPSLP
ncbi:MAG: hypothetical protein H8K11_07245 [Nitrospira sp.]|nr:hypothetical protein [Nitrospira sp.]